jgi:probable F420-dependent oxidoreductase
MDLGFAVPVAGSWATPAHQVALARRAEELGYASLWTFQRLLYPADVPDADDPRRWPPVYRSVHDPLITLGFLAAHTERARLGVAVLNMPWFSPLLLAKQAATLDTMSGGRLDLGLGIGWAAEEFTATGAPADRRGARGEEFVACLRACWTDEVVDFHGEFHDVGPAYVDPKPVQRPHPPVLLGGGVPAALRRAGRVADGWISSSGQDLASIGAAAQVVRGAAREAGRDPEAVRVICRGVVKVRPAGLPDRRPLTGSYDEVRADLATLAEQGVSEVFVDLNFDPDIGSVDADPDESVRRATDVLTALAPEPGHA